MQESQSGKVRLKLAGSRSDWEEASAGFSEATAFHRYDFLSAIAPCLHCRFEPLIIYYGNQKVGVAPLLVRQYGPFCVVNRVPFPYLGPLVQTSLVAATLAALSAHARRRRALDHYQSFSPSSAPPAAAGFRMRLERTFIIPLRDRSDADLMKAMDSTRRKEVRRAERLGLRVDEASVEDFQLMDIWSRQLYAAQGLPPGYPPGSYERVFKELSGTPGTAFYSARVDGRTVGVQINLASSRPRLRLASRDRRVLQGSFSADDPDVAHRFAGTRCRRQRTRSRRRAQRRYCHLQDQIGFRRASLRSDAEDHSAVPAATGRPSAHAGGRQEVCAPGAPPVRGALEDEPAPPSVPQQGQWFQGGSHLDPGFSYQLLYRLPALGAQNLAAE